MLLPPHAQDLRRDTREFNRACLDKRATEPPALRLGDRLLIQDPLTHAYMAGRGHYGGGLVIVAVPTSSGHTQTTYGASGICRDPLLTTRF